MPILDDELHPLIFLFSNRHKLKFLYTTINTFIVDNQELKIINNENIQLNNYTNNNMTFLNYQKEIETNLFQDKKVEVDTFLKIMKSYE